MGSGFLKEDMENAIADMETLAKATNTEPFEIYLLGGAGCVLAGYLERATRDFDIIDLDYAASLGRVMKPLEPFDLIEPKLAALAAGYKARAARLPQFEYLPVYVLSREDIIISKLARLNERDFHDISELLPLSDISLIFTLLKSLLDGDLLPKAKNTLLENMARCLEEIAAKGNFHVQDYLQQFEELRKRF
ncbi:MAG: DUF6036 family nucleotidyltransferase [Defluviitaleaceae bacterium]|nr:DUF6036 family nucleotidyltransferase [Defluviitaleaceae bacterium]MCL2262126.1 DUF6036 family nucleotidyltransferase [Defluviitaleaceae bacterium]